MRQLLGLLGLAALLAAPVVEAQTVRADRVTLNAGPCVITSGSAAPNGSRVGNICDTFIQTGTGAIWTKTSGAGTSSGWIATLAGAGTPGALVKWTGTGATVGDSIASEAAGLLTITGAAKVTGAATMNAATITATAAVGGTLDVTGAATLRSTASITGDTTIGGNTTLGGYIGTASYASQITGWRITPAGAADVRYLFTNELRANIFTADAESVLAGSMRVTKSYSTVAQPFTCPTSGTATLWVKDAATYGDAPVFENTGLDWVVIHTLTRSAFGPFTIADCVGTVSNWADGTGANAGQQSWTFTRGAGANGGTMTNAVAVPVDQLVQDMGATGNGYIEMTAVDGANGVNAPYLQVTTWATSPVAANLARQCRLGNLVGIFGNGPEYGLACGATVGQGGFLRLSNLSFEIRNVPVDLYDGATQVVRLDPAGPSLALGSPLPTSYGVNSGLWAGKDSDGIYKLRVGDPTGNRLTWNGAQLQIIGEGSGITNINGGNIQAGTISASAINITPNGAALNSDPNALSTSAWQETGNPGYQATSTRVTDGVAGYSSMRSQVGHSSAIAEVKPTPVDGGHKTYRLHAWVRAGGGSTGSFLFGVLAYNAGGGGLGGAFIASIPGPIATTWTDVSGILPLPSNTATVEPLLYLNWDNVTLTRPGWMEAQDIRIEEVLPSTLIKDGAITTTKIAAHTITGDNIKAGSITANEINVAAGYGANLIANSTFEGATPALGLAGWTQDLLYPDGAMVNSCCGIHGPGTLYLAPGAGQWTVADYLAVPVSYGQTYRVAMDVYAGQATPAGLYVRMLQSNTNSAPRYVRGGGTIPPGDVGADTVSDICANCGLAVGWNHIELVYTPPSPTTWVSMSLFDYTCPQGAAAVCQALHFDGVEMEQQIGAGSIKAGTITGDRIAARTIISGNIATGTLGANEIAAGSLTADRLAARTITSGYIATGTITANELAATSITADKLNVSSLSAISANLGTVTAGTINGVTINGTTINGSTINAGGGNEVVLNGSGITISSGVGANNSVKWSGGGVIYSSGGTMTLRNGDIQIGANNGSTTYFFESNAFQGSAGLGTQSIPWTSLFVTPPQNNGGAGGSSFYPLQLNVNDNQVHQKRNGYDGQCVITAGKSLYIDHGIVIGCV
jgi:hypothetical protein